MKSTSKTIVAYASFVRWVTLDSLWRFKARALMILAASALGVGFQVAVFGLLLVYARHFAVGDLIRVAGAQLDPRASWGLLALMGVAVTILLLLSAVFIYISQRGILRMGREYGEFCAKRVFRLLGGGGDLFSTMKGEGSVDSFLLRLVRSDSRFAGRVLRMLLALAIPTVTLFPAITVAFYLEPRLSLIIATLGSVFIVYQYRASRLAAYHSMRHEQFASAAAAEYRKLIQHYKHDAIPNASSFMEERLFAGSAVRKQLDAYEGRLRSVENSRLVSGLFTSVIVGLILGIMGVGIIRDGAGWERLLAYVVALRFALTSLQSVFSSLTAINRFYPQVRRYMDFVLSYSPEDAMRHPPRDQYAIALHGDAVALPGSRERLEIERGDRVALVTPRELNRYALAAVCETLLDEETEAVLSALHSARHVSSLQTCPSGSIRSVLRLSETAQWNDLRGLFASDALHNEARDALSKSLDKAISPATWALLEPRLQISLALIAASQSGCTWLFVDAADLQVLDAEVVDFYLEKFSEAIVCVLYRRNVEQVGLFRENWVVVADSQVVGIGSPDWFIEIEPQVIKIFEPNRKDKAGPNDYLDEE
ncbi:hypothetical protein N9M01_07345 [Luminiphilus sp.]|nr:hypothetical protein [Luminiphilus sp.]